jgi:RNA polymerase sigma-70 factor (ECF subfamily)
MMPDNDKEVLPIAAAREGQGAAWDVLFQRYRWPLYVFLVESIQDEQSALDLLQESFIRAHRHIQSLRSDGRFGSWLFGIARQLAVQHVRKRKPDVEWLDDHAEETDLLQSDPLQSLLQSEDVERCLNALDQLSYHHREVLALCYLEEFKLEQIASITQVSLGTVKSRLHFARKALNQILTQQNDEDTSRTFY